MVLDGCRLKLRELFEIISIEIIIDNEVIGVGTFGNDKAVRNMEAAFAHNTTKAFVQTNIKPS